MNLAQIWAQPVRLAEGKRTSWIMLMPEGEYHHPVYGKLNFSHAKLAEFKRNFDNRVRKIDISLDVDHKAAGHDSRATGWVKRVTLQGTHGDMPAGLWGEIEWTPYGRQLLSDKEYKYFSPEFGTHTDEATKKKYENVLIGGALTNRPFLKVMPAVQLADNVSWRPWGQVNKSKLPAACFLWIEDIHKKSTWHLPIYESPDGIKRGRLNGNAVKAAYAALHGARTGKPMRVPASVRAKIERLHKELFEGDKDVGKKAAELAKEAAMQAYRLVMAEASKSSRFEEEEDEDEDELDELAKIFAERKRKAAKSSDDDEEMDEEDGDGEDGDDEEDDEEDDDEEDQPKRRKASTPKAKTAKTMPKTMARKTAERSAKKATEPTHLTRLLAEQSRQLRELEARDFERDVDDILRSWETGKTLTFAATESGTLPRTRDVAGPKSLRKTRVQLTPKAARKIKEYLLDEGFQLSEESREKTLDMIQTLLSETAWVETGSRSSSFDQEARHTKVSKSDAAVDGIELDDYARQLARRDRKVLSELSPDEKVRYYVEAEAALAS